MLVIPVEKSFDWKHTPVILFIVVIFNVFVFFNFQSDDDAVINEAFTSYQEQNYIELEWPFLKSYLQEKNQLAKLEKYTLQFDKKEYSDIISYILFDNDFYLYLRQDQYEHFQSQDVGDWFFVRRDINEAMQATTLVSYGLVPSDIKIFSLFSYQFLHGGIAHLIGNLFFLVIFGFAVEAAIGHLFFLLFYILAGVLGGLLYALLNSNSPVPLVGASGSISGAMAMYLGIFRFRKIEFFYWFYILIGYFKAPAAIVLLFYIGNEVYNLAVLPDSSVAFLCHIGGFLSGVACIAAAYLIKPDIFNQEYIEEDQIEDQFKQQKAAIYELLGKYQFSAAEKMLEEIVHPEVADSKDQQAKTPSLRKNPLDFELAIIRYNIERINPNKNFTKHLVELLTTPQLDDNELLKIQEIWQKHSDLLLKIKPEILIKIATNLANAKPPKQASLLFERLYKQAKDSNNTQYNDQLAILAKRIADAYEVAKNVEQQRKFIAIKQGLLMGESH